MSEGGRGTTLGQAQESAIVDLQILREERMKKWSIAQ
jgi:hypothetical protein